MVQVWTAEKVKSFFQRFQKTDEIIEFIFSIVFPKTDQKYIYFVAYFYAQNSAVFGKTVDFSQPVTPAPS